MNTLGNSFDKKIVFRDVAAPIPADLRPIWRISIILLILKMVSIGTKASSKKILALSSILLSQKKRQLFKEFVNDKSISSELTIRFDPAVDRAIDMALAENLVTLDHNKNILLSEEGASFADRILENGDALKVEVDFLAQFKKRQVSEKEIMSLILG